MAVALPVLLMLALGACGGLITTLAGFGGGMFFSLALAPVLGPAAALGLSSPALALGHLHRVYVYRVLIDRDIAWRFARATAPAAIAGALLAAWVPERLLALGLLGGASLAVAQALGKIPTQLGRRGLAVGAAGVGFLAASCGGGGVLLPPTLMSTGLRGRAFVATAATGSLVIQLVRTLTYGSAGLVSWSQAPLIFAGALGLLAGNTLGRRMSLGDAATERMTHAVLALVVLLGLTTLSLELLA